jgi:hypothetical protein
VRVAGGTVTVAAAALLALPPAVALVALPPDLLAVTEIEAAPDTEPAVAVTLPVPTVWAVNVTGLAGFAEKLPSAGDTDQLGVTDTAFPKPSLPLAVNDVCRPTRTWTLAGVTVIVASAAAVTVSVWAASL